MIIYYNLNYLSLICFLSACHCNIQTSTNVQTKTWLHVLRSAVTLWGATGVSVRKAISWKKMGKHAPKGREVRVVFLLRHFLFIQGHIWLWCGVLQTQTPGNHYTSQLLVHVRTALSLKHTAAPVTPGLFWFAECFLRKTLQNVQAIINSLFSPPDSVANEAVRGCRFATSSHEFIFHYLL